MSCTITLETKLSFANRDTDQFIVSLIDMETETTSFINIEKGKPTKKRSNKEHCQWELVDYNSLPEFLKHNEFVVNYYRSEWPLKQTILSIFSLHNETLNIWTHLIGFFVFLALAATMMVSIYNANNEQTTSPISSPKYSNMISSLLVLSPSPAASTIEPESTKNLITRWPFYAYLVGVMFCLLTSSICHLLSCHSQRTCYITLRCDYVGISVLIVTSFYPLVYYTFTCYPFVRNVYMGFITIFGVVSMLVSFLPTFERPELRFVRAGLFTCMGLSGLVPIVHKMVAFGNQPEAVTTTKYEMGMLCSYGIGVIVYALRIPERWMPGMFDLAGHSHQLWHVLVIVGAYTQYLSGLVYLSWRDNQGCY